MNQTFLLFLVINLIQTLVAPFQNGGSWSEGLCVIETKMMICSHTGSHQQRATSQCCRHNHWSLSKSSLLSFCHCCLFEASFDFFLFLLQIYKSTTEIHAEGMRTFLLLLTMPIPLLSYIRKKNAFSQTATAAATAVVFKTFYLFSVDVNVRGESY